MIRAPVEYTIGHWPLSPGERPSLCILTDVELLRLLIGGGLTLGTAVTFLDDLDKTRYRELSAETWAWADRT